MMRVLIADDHGVVREGIRHVLRAGDEFEVVGEAADGREAVRLAEMLRPDVIVLDLSMPELSGFDAAIAIRQRAPESAILVLSMHDDREYVERSQRAGARGYVRKDSPPAELRRAVRTVASGGSYFPPAPPVAGREPRAEDGPRHRLASLTGREREVLVQIAHGATNKAIAGKLGVSVRTVESHRDSLMRKLDLKGAAALTRFALQAGLDEP